MQKINKEKNKRNFVIGKIKAYSLLQKKNLAIGMFFIFVALLADLGGPLLISRLLK